MGKRALKSSWIKSAVEKQFIWGLDKKAGRGLEEKFKCKMYLEALVIRLPSVCRAMALKMRKAGEWLLTMLV